MFVYTRADNHLLLIMRRQQRHEMNMSASVTLKPAISHFYSFVLSLLFQLVNNILFSTKQGKKLASLKLAK